MICGDVLFEMNTGRVDLPGGDGEALKKSIESLSILDIEYLLPGHMGVVTGSGQCRGKLRLYPSQCLSLAVIEVD